MDEKKLEEKELKLEARLKKIKDMEDEIKAREKEIKAREKARKQVILRIPQGLWEDIAAWAEDDFRSINGQIEYILTEAVRKRKG